MQLKVSKQYSEVLLAMAEGKRVRRSCWPDGFLLSEEKSTFYIDKPGNQRSKWNGPSEEDIQASDWVIIYSH